MSKLKRYIFSSCTKFPEADYAKMTVMNGFWMFNMWFKASSEIVF